MKKWVLGLLIALALLPSAGEAATRFYLESSGSTDIAPAGDAGWEKTIGAIRAPANTVKAGTALTSTDQTENNASTTFDVAVGQFVSRPLAAQTISGNVSGQVRALESVGTADDDAQMTIYVMAPDATTVRGVLLGFNGAALSNEFDASTLTNRKFPKGGSAALSSVAAQAGDYLVIEVGYRAHNSSALTRTGTLRFGSSAAGDMAVDETSTTDNNPWIEFDGTITFYASGQDVLGFGQMF